MKTPQEIIKEYFLLTNGYNWDDLSTFYQKTAMFTFDDVLKIIELIDKERQNEK